MSDNVSQLHAQKHPGLGKRIAVFALLLVLVTGGANGFLYNMARAMAGTCVYAAEGKFPPEAVAQILLIGDRPAAGPTVPPGGLYMTQLWYDDGRAVFHVG